MRLMLSLWAEKLPKASVLSKELPDPFAVVTVLHKEPGVKPTVLGQTEVINNTTDPDWTKHFTIEDFDLGKPMHLVITIYDKKAEDDKTPMGSVLMEVGNILGAKGSVLAKEMKQGGGILAVRLEEKPEFSAGTLELQLRGLNLTNKDGFGLGLMNQSDPYFELQRMRRSAKRNVAVWDSVYRSTVISENLSPVWPKTFIDLDMLVNEGRKDEKFNIAVFDADKNGKSELIGQTKVDLNMLLFNINETALNDIKAIDRNKSFVLKDKDGKNAGEIIVISAEITGVEEPPPPPAEPEPEPEPEQEPEPEATPTPPEVEPAASERALPAPPALAEEEPEIVLTFTASEDEIDLEPADNHITPTFIHYVAGGCELRVITAIDATSHNGNPREESSLHHFKDSEEDKNDYEQALNAICSVLSKYDSDQKFPIFGFGAKIDGELNHCFPFGNGEADGVDGILKLYRKTFRSGLVMSAPRAFSEVIKKAGADAKANMEKGQSYSILLIFTSGDASEPDATIAALKEVDDAPLSVVVIGVGEVGDFTAVQGLESSSRSQEGGLRDKLRFVHYNGELKEDRDKLTAAALDHIPKQLEAYLISKNIYPQDAESASQDEIEVLPYDPASDVTVPVEINNTTGELTVTEDVKPPEETSSSHSMLEKMKKMGNDLTTKVKKSKEFQKVKGKLNKQARQKAKQKMNKLLGTKLF